MKSCDRKARGAAGIRPAAQVAFSVRVGIVGCCDQRRSGQTIFGVCYTSLYGSKRVILHPTCEVGGVDKLRF